MLGSNDGSAMAVFCPAYFGDYAMTCGTIPQICGEVTIGAAEPAT